MKAGRSANKVVKALKADGFQVFFVGGFVRDQLLKRESDNLDIATDALPEDVERILHKANIKTKDIGKKFGSILALPTPLPRHKVGASPLEGENNLKETIEITTFRKEGRYSNHRHPDKVEFIKDYLQDAKRRDFTINALYFDPIKKELHDPTNGQKDLNAKLLRFVGDPKKRIDEDALRMLRGVRLATQLGFKLEKNSFAAIKTRAKYIQDVSGERVKAELDKILLSENRAQGLRLLEDVGLLRFIWPELATLKNFSHNSKEFHLEGDMFEHTLLAVENAKGNDLDLLYAVLFHDIGKPDRAKLEGSYTKTRGHAELGAEMFKKIALRLKFSKKSQRLIEWAIRNHMLPLTFTALSDKQKASLALEPNINFLTALAEADNSANLRLQPDGSIAASGSTKLTAAKEFLAQAKKRLSIVPKLAKAESVMKYSKLKPGKELGQKIQDVKIQIILGKIKSETELKEYLST